jgi:hypothetical protein
MTKLTTKRFTVPVVIALAIAAVSTTAQAAKIDPAITVDAFNAATAAGIEEVAGVADENGVVTGVAVTYGGQMAAGTIKLNTKNAQALGSTLARAIIAKPESAAAPENNWTNKADEIAEVAATLVERFSTSSNIKKFNKKTAPKVVLALVKGIFKETKNTATLAAAASPNFFGDVVGSALLAAIQAPGTDSKTDDKIYKLLKKNNKKLAGKPNKDAIKSALDEARLADVIALAKYEIGPVADPETDTRNG